MIKSLFFLSISWYNLIGEYMKKITKKILNTVSKIDVDTINNYEKERVLHDIIGMTFLKKYHYVDTRILVQNHTVGVRLFFPKEKTNKLIIYFHGGGWVVGSASNYTRTCDHLAVTTNSIVISVDYRLAPEFPFPNAVIDCYCVTKYFYSKESFLDIDEKNIVLMGDSAGGNLAAVVSYISSIKKDFQVKNQILLYPLTYHDHSNNSPFASIQDNGEDWILTTKRINEYMKLYVKEEQYIGSPYVAPLNAKDLKNQPRTLIITAELDPLRDEGEAYGYKLRDFKNEVSIHRIKDMIHGFFSINKNSKANKECYQIICDFLSGDEKDEKKMV